MTTLIEPAESQTRAQAAARSPLPEKLALFGGPRGVTARYREGWRQVGKLDLLKIMAFGLYDINTYFVGGPVAAFEEAFARLTDCRYALTMNSGTATLHSAYFAAGVGVGDEVIVPSYTFYASAAPILQCGGWPVFCDIDPATLTADPDDVERRITPRTKAICVVHLWGNPARMDRLVEIARRHNVALIEDCSHAHGATYQGRPVGSWGDIGCFSLQGFKAVSGGEAGIVVTSNPTYFDRILALGHYGRIHEQIDNTLEIGTLSLGIKFRPHIYAILLAQGALKRLPELNRRRQRNYDILREELAGCDAVQTIEENQDSRRGGFLEFMFRVRPDLCGGWNRGAFVQAAAAEGVPVRVDRYPMLHREPLFTTADLSECGGAIGAGYRAANRKIYTADDLPATERVCPHLVTIPPLTKVSEKFVRQCGRALRKVAENATFVRDFRSGE